MSIAWPAPLVRAIALRRSVLFLGAGITRNSTNAAGERPKLWIEFLEAALDAVECTKALKTAIRRLIASGDLLMACEVIKARFPPGGFNQFCRDQFITPQFTHAKIHEVIARLDSRIVATPNFDKIYENYINHSQHNSVTVKNYADDDIAEMLRSDNHFVLKVHGTIDKPGQMIFTRSDYAKARNSNAAFYSLLGAMLKTYTFVFLGCGLDDPDVRLLLEDYTFGFPATLPHYFILSREHPAYRLRDAYERSLGIQLVGYDPADGHKLLTSSLEELVTLVTTERESIGKLGKW